MPDKAIVITAGDRNALKNSMVTSNIEGDSFLVRIFEGDSNLNRGLHVSIF